MVNHVHSPMHDRSRTRDYRDYRLYLYIVAIKPRDSDASEVSSHFTDRSHSLLGLEIKNGKGTWFNGKDVVMRKK